MPIKPKTNEITKVIEMPHYCGKSKCGQQNFDKVIKINVWGKKIIL